MSKHYQEIVDEIFGFSNYKHRTLRTLIDPYSTEWSQTTISEKLTILKKILDSGEISFEALLMSYKFYYSSELANKKRVVDSIEDGLARLLIGAIKSY